MTYEVISISNRRPEAWYYLFDEYFKSLHPYQPKVFQPSFWGGLSTKPKLLYHLILTKAITSKYIIFTDCWDFLFAATPEEIMEAYAFFKAPIVISTEQNCFPTDLKDEFDKLTPLMYRYLNSGFICGETDAIMTCLEAMDLPNLKDDHYDEVNKCNYHPNDQFEWQKIFVQQPVEIKLDYKQILSQTLHGANISDFDFSKPRIRNKITGSYPCTLHFNGGSKDDMLIRSPILKHLNLLQ